MPDSHPLPGFLAVSPGRHVRRLLVAGLAMAGAVVHGQNIERDPINYSASTPRNNVVAELQDRLEKGSAKLEYESAHGYLKSLLQNLDVPESSQVLVFSKTSLQRERISPKTPRAIYYNDDVMIGFCLRGYAIEISAPDDVLGTAYYTLEQRREADPVPQRQTDSCMLCHSSSSNQGFPGHLVRSLFVDGRGFPQLASGSYRTDHASPLEERWGGWYVTGTSGKQTHLGNLIRSRPRRPGEKIENPEGVNVTDLKDRFTTGLYLKPSSDIVSLMVLEHQVEMLNRVARANLETRMALHYQQEFNKALGRPAGEQSESAWSRIHNVGDDVARYMVFDKQIELTDRIEGTSSFATDFAARGPRDSKGRSLRDFDLQTRLFRYPCSYQIYSRAFNALPAEVKDYVYKRLWEMLNGQSTDKDDPKIDPEDGQAVIEILRDTKPDLPDYWKTPAPTPR